MKHPRLYPIPKGSLPLQGWAVDLMPDLPPGSNNHTIAILTVDCYSKFVELASIADRSSTTTAQWFLHTIIHRYGKPVFVRTDHGTEFRGQFDKMLELHGI